MPNPRSVSKTSGDSVKNNCDFIFYKEIDEIVNYLNAQTGTKLPSGGKITSSLLKTLFTKGYTILDVKKVIDLKKEWLISPK